MLRGLLCALCVLAVLVPTALKVGVYDRRRIADGCLECAYAAATENGAPPACAHNHSGTFYGIFTVASAEDRRQVYRRHLRAHNVSSYAFILGATRPGRTEKYGDIITLGCCYENMNLGKTFVYFKHIRELYPCFEYYVKADDDTAFWPARVKEALLRSGGAEYVGNTLGGPDVVHYYPNMIYQNVFRAIEWNFKHAFQTGALYAVRHTALSRLVEGLRPTELTGDEDRRMGFWMGEVGASYADAGSAWLHPCKQLDMLERALALL